MNIPGIRNLHFLPGGSGSVEKNHFSDEFIKNASDIKTPKLGRYIVKIEF